MVAETVQIYPTPPAMELGLLNTIVGVWVSHIAKVVLLMASVGTGSIFTVTVVVPPLQPAADGVIV